jgi:hypothetical protein
MTPGRWVNRMPMPFWRRAHFQITGVPGRLFLRVARNTYDESAASHLRVVWRQERPTTSAGDFEYVHAVGAGRLVATVLAVEPPDASTDKQWWEGDLHSTTDGRRAPGVQGTGYEDDHFGGWSNEFFSTPFSLPLSGEPRVVLGDRNGQYNGDVSLYRVWPGLTFSSELRHSVEHGTGNNRSVDLSAATFLYFEPGTTLTTTDTFDPCDSDSRARHALTGTGQDRLAPPLTATFEGPDKTPLTRCHLTQTGAVSFRMRTLDGGAGFFLRRIFDQSKRGPTVIVSIDGFRVGRWYVAETNAASAWGERDFFVPRDSFTDPDNVTITLEIEPQPATPIWDAAEYRAITIVPGRVRP